MTYKIEVHSRRNDKPGSYTATRRADVIDLLFAFRKYDLNKGARVIVYKKHKTRYHECLNISDISHISDFEIYQV